MFCRAMKVFDVRQSGLTKLQINDPSAVIGLARDIITLRVLGKPLLPPNKKAPTAAGAKDVKPQRKYIAAEMVR
jgi:hypothetical protein